jgi:transcriptional regulator with XRE-family HTH domain|nr:MAG TPA: helix-turn-helix domain protein [Caudoviricetes sp.]
MSFGNNLKKIRQDCNLTQEELAKKIDTSRSNIANYENNKNMPSIDVLSKLSKVLDCSIDYLLGKSDERNPKETDPLGLAKIGFNMKDYTPPTETQKQQIKGLLEVIMKDNKKDVGDKKNESK